ncbi:MAG: pilus assembly protein, partial [Hyphomicrobiales bacterium]
PAPFVGSCDHKDLVVKNKNGSTTLSPGVYCGGISIQHGDVEFEPGVYIIKDGSFSITANSTVVGEYVGFYLTGDNAVYDFGSNSDINFSAPRDGPLAGILFFEDRDAPLMRRHVIKSKRADNLLGTIYLPSGVFVVETNNKVADQSAYTAVIARRIELSKKPNLYLNADYGSTDVPVPSGLGPVGGNIFLAK